jgi:phosphoglycolate phosphatase
MKYESSSLVFDLDGTLSDPSLGIARCFNFALSQHGQPEVPEQSLHKQIGPPLDETFRTLVPGISESDVVRYVVSYRERYAEIGYAENELYVGIPEALHALVHSGKSLGVCTSKRVDFAEQILEMFGLRHHFAFVDGGDIGISKAMQLQALKERGAIDDRAIMIGDRAVDINSASENGLRGIGVMWGFGDEAELSAASPVAIFDRVDAFSELGA